MKITSLIFKHFRCNARNTKISFAESCIVKFSHWSHCSDVLDALPIRYMANIMTKTIE